MAKQTARCRQSSTDYDFAYRSAPRTGHAFVGGCGCDCCYCADPCCWWGERSKQRRLARRARKAQKRGLDVEEFDMSGLFGPRGKALTDLVPEERAAARPRVGGAGEGDELQDG